ncbi:hypothetical protein ACFQ2K_16020 [Streptomyces sanglieri]|uniref:Uncharacterized protein n=1 Tax=Streptomyces sanglieri TaxID=193460 RepID=A0ABW2WR72_9ACTN
MPRLAGRRLRGEQFPLDLEQGVRACATGNDVLNSRRHFRAWSPAR